MTNPVKAFTDYHALKLHFTSDYDFFRYGGKHNQTKKNLDARNDKWLFHKLATNPDYFDYILANFAYESKPPHVSSLINDRRCSENYLRYKRIRQSIHSQFKNDIKKLVSDFNTNFVVDNNQFPVIVTLANRRVIEFETLVILCSLTGCIDRWDQQISDTVIWPKISKKIRKYMPFVKYDREKIMQIIFEVFEKPA